MKCLCVVSLKIIKLGCWKLNQSKTGHREKTLEENELGRLACLSESPTWCASHGNIQRGLQSQSEGWNKDPAAKVQKMMWQNGGCSVSRMNNRVCQVPGRKETGGQVPCTIPELSPELASLPEMLSLKQRKLKVLGKTKHERGKFFPSQQKHSCLQKSTGEVFTQRVHRHTAACGEVLEYVSASPCPRRREPNVREARARALTPAVPAVVPQSMAGGVVF